MKLKSTSEFIFEQTPKNEAFAITDNFNWNRRRQQSYWWNKLRYGHKRFKSIESGAKTDRFIMIESKESSTIG